MVARRLVVLLALLALVSNSFVYAWTGAAGKPAPQSQAFNLVSLKTEIAGAATRILVESSAPPLYTVFKPTPRLIIIDMPGGEGAGIAPEYVVTSPLVEWVKVRKSPAVGGSDRAATRVEIGLKADVRDRSSVSGNVLVIELSPAQALAQASANPAVEKEARRADARSEDRSLSNAAPSVYVYPTPVTSRKAAAEPATSAPAPVSTMSERVQPQQTVSDAGRPESLRRASLVRGVRPESAEGGLRIVVETDGTAQFKDFVLPDPWRVVVDIAGVRSAVGNKILSVGTGGVDRVRLGQPSGDVVRIVLDTKGRVPYRVVREGAQLVILVGNVTSSRVEPKPAAEVKPDVKPEVKVAGQRVDNQEPVANPNASPNLLAQVGKPVVAAADSNTPVNKPLANAQPVRETITQTVPAPPARTVADVQRNTSQTAAPQVAMATSRSGELAFCDAGYTGGLISFDLRAGVDVRDMLRFISQEHGVNFIVDKSVGAVPVDIRVTDIPWNQVIDSVLRANRLGAVCESNGRIIRIATLGAIKEEQEQQRAIKEEEAKQVPLTTKILRLKYARAAGSLGSAGAGASGRNGGGGGSESTKGIISIAEKRLSPRGRIEMDARTNSLIVSDLPEYVQAVEGIIAQLDKPEPQVEIEARIVIANRSFLRDIGNELAGAGVNTGNGATGFLQTGASQLGSGGGVTTPTGQGGGGNSGGGGGSGGGAGGSANTGQIGPNLLGPFASNAMRVGAANTVLSLTTGLIGTGILSMALSASERKGQIRIVASPRITAQDNQTAEIINGVQIPVQTVTNNTVTTTFVTAALRLEITPQIVEETGEVLMKVVAENNTVNSALATQLNGGTPGINTQSATSVVRVQDGGTTVMGGVNIDTESNTQNRTPGVSRVPVVGNLFKRKTTERSMDEILFFITPRIVRGDGTFIPQRSSLEGTPNPLNQQVGTPAISSNQADQKAQKGGKVKADVKAKQ